MDHGPASQIDATARPAVVLEQSLASDALRRRGALLTGEALADWPQLLGQGRGLGLSGLAGVPVLLDGVRLAPASDGRVDLSLLPLALVDKARLIAGPAGVAQGAGAVAGIIDLALADGGPQAAGRGGVQGGRAIGGLDLRLGEAGGWLAGGYTAGGALPDGGRLLATAQRRWHVAGRVEQQVAGAVLWARGLFARRQEGEAGADWRDLALGLSGGTRWQWRLALAHGGQFDTGSQAQPAGRSQQEQLIASVSGATGLMLPAAAEPVSMAAGGSWRRLRLAAGSVTARELFAEAAVPLVQDRPAAENLVATAGVRQLWAAGRAATLWQLGGRWEAFPGIALRGQVARGIDDLATRASVGRSIGLIATPAFVPGLALAVDRRWQDASADSGGRVAAFDISASWRGAVGDGAVVALSALATTGRRQARAGLLRATLETGRWAVMASWRLRPDGGSGADLAVERALSDRVRLIASVGRNGGAGGSSALVQVVAGL